MKSILFTNLPYAFSILKPLEVELKGRGYEVLWYVPEDIVDKFPYKDSNYTTSIKDLKKFKADAIFVPGNEVPFYLRGVKVQVFHGLAGEKKGHFRIRDFFDLYLTQGPYFTNRFKELAKKHKNFEVMQTGWCKLDKLFEIKDEVFKEKEQLLKKYEVKKIILYAPTFSPSLTSAPFLKEQIAKLAQNRDLLVVVKFHDLMDKELKDIYTKIDGNIFISPSSDITKCLQIADIMISDTSSVVYEFLLLNKPVVTLNSRSENIKWFDTKEPAELLNAVLDLAEDKDDFASQREETIKLYHPYRDGKSAKRMVDAVLEYIDRHGIPNKRAVPWHRKIKIYKRFGF